MLRLDAALARPAAKQHGLATRDQLRSAGLTDRQVDLRIESGLLRVVHTGVLHHAAAPFTAKSRLLAGVLACGPTAVGSHRSAATVHGFEGIHRARPEITVCDTTKPRLRDATIHRTDTLESVDRTIVDGIPVTSKARTILDLGAVVPFEVVERVVDVAVVRDQVSEVSLVSAIDRLGRSGRRGTAALRAILLAGLPDDKLASVLEHDLHQLIRKAAVPSPVLQFPLVCADGRTVYLDFAWPSLRIAVEADGHRWHSSRKQLAHDRVRRRAIQASGWEHYDYGWGEVHDDAHAVVGEIARLLSR
jgi:very-short-patch-repair endonuclease